MKNLSNHCQSERLRIMPNQQKDVLDDTRYNDNNNTQAGNKSKNIFSYRPAKALIDLLLEKKGDRSFVGLLREEILKLCGLSRRNQETARKKLRELGILKEKKGIGNRLFFWLDKIKLENLLRGEPNALSKDIGPQPQRGEPSRVEAQVVAVVPPVRAVSETQWPNQNTWFPPSQARAFDWLPEGAWKVEGRLDCAFRDWLANKWLIAYGGDIHKKRADVLAHFKKDPANLAIHWEIYAEEMRDRAENLKLRLSRNMEISEEEQKLFLSRARALQVSLAPEHQITHTQKKETISLPPSKNPDRSENWATPQQVASALGKYLKNLRSFPEKKTIERDREKNQLEKLNSWLLDPILQKEAISRAIKLGYRAIYNDFGTPIAFEEVEF